MEVIRFFVSPIICPSRTMKIVIDHFVEEPGDLKIKTTTQTKKHFQVANHGPNNQVAAEIDG